MERVRGGDCGRVPGGLRGQRGGRGQDHRCGRGLAGGGSSATFHCHLPGPFGVAVGVVGEQSDLLSDVPGADHTPQVQLLRVVLGTLRPHSDPLVLRVGTAA